jgi:hypothetical protein
MRHLTTDELTAGIDEVRRSPSDCGRVELIVSRPAPGARALLDEACLDLTVGLVGDTWSSRGSRATADGASHPDMQLTLMNARAATLIADGRERRALAGDQLYVDLDLSGDNLPPGTRLALGTAVIEITAEPHRGCAKFRDRFGVDAVRFVNSPVGLALNLRGVNAKVVRAGTVRVGNTVQRVSTSVEA